MGVLVIRALLFRVRVRAPDFGNLPHEPGLQLGSVRRIVVSSCGNDMSVCILSARHYTMAHMS